MPPGIPTSGALISNSDVFQALGHWVPQFQGRIALQVASLTSSASHSLQHEYWV